MQLVRVAKGFLRWWWDTSKEIYAELRRPSTVLVFAHDPEISTTEGGTVFRASWGARSVYLRQEPPAVAWWFQVEGPGGSDFVSEDFPDFEAARRAAVEYVRTGGGGADGGGAPPKASPPPGRTGLPTYAAGLT